MDFSRGKIVGQHSRVQYEPPWLPSWVEGPKVQYNKSRYTNYADFGQFLSYQHILDLVSTLLKALASSSCSTPQLPISNPYHNNVLKLSNTRKIVCPLPQSSLHSSVLVPVYHSQQGALIRITGCGLCTPAPPSGNNSVLWTHPTRPIYMPADYTLSLAEDFNTKANKLYPSNCLYPWLLCHKHDMCLYHHSYLLNKNCSQKKNVEG